MNVPTLGLCSHAGLWRSATEKSGCAVDGSTMKELKGTGCIAQQAVRLLYI